MASNMWFQGPHYSKNLNMPYFIWKWKWSFWEVVFNDACIYSVDEDPNGEDVYINIYIYIFFGCAGFSSWRMSFSLLRMDFL